VARELADIFNYLVLLSNDLGIDLLGSSKMKIEENRAKYPVEKSRGTAKKYKEL
jgi:NTP pyrophosphatase (non-canonical NTP hydrolase)